MGPLPRHHIARQRLIDLALGTGSAAAAPVLAIEAGGGYGKSTFAAELSRRGDGPTIVVNLAEGDDDPAIVVTRMASAARRAGLTDVSTTIAAASNSMTAVDALLEALDEHPDPTTITFDDAHFAPNEGGRVLQRLVQHIAPPHRLLVLARRLPGSVRGVVDNGSVNFMSAADLAFTLEESVRLFRDGFALDLVASDVAAMWRATGGWPAALALAAPRLRHGLESITAFTGPRRQLVRHLLDEYLAELDEITRRAVGQLAALAPLTLDAADRVSEVPAVLERAIAAGIPFSMDGDHRYALPDPVREHLAADRLDPDVARRAAAELAALGDHLASANTMISAGASVDAAAAICALPAEEIAAIPHAELRALLDRLPGEAVRAVPQVLLVGARAAWTAGRVFERDELLARATRIADECADDRLRRAVDAERARDLARDDRVAEAEALATRVIDTAQPDEQATLQWAHHARGLARMWRRDIDSISAARQDLSKALALSRGLGDRSVAAEILVPLAHGVHWALGDVDEALASLEAALTAIGGHSRRRGIVLTFRGEVLDGAGRFEEGAVYLDEARHIAEMIADDRIAGYANWESARAASMCGDADAVHRSIEAAERGGGDWLATSAGADFLADAADFLDRVGDVTLARHYLTRAQARRAESETAVRVSAAAVEARHGDPAQAIALIDALDAFERVEPRERARLRVLRAFAELRRTPSPPPPLSVILGPFARFASLVGVWEADAVTALGAPVIDDAVSMVNVLGALAVSRRGHAVTLASGQPARLVAALAALGGRAHADVVAEELWPDQPGGEGRRRLRNVLMRLRQSSGEIVVRDGDVLAFADRVQVDALRFSALADIALAPGDPSARLAAAVEAVASYRGDLLSEAPYEEFAVGPRERLRWRALELLDFIADVAERRGDFDEAVRVAQRAVELQPYDESWFVRLARLLAAQGRRASARAVIERGRAVAAELGVPPALELVEIEESLDQG